MYNKTALKKIKKDDLVQMYLDLQAKNYDDKMEEVLEKCCTNAIDETVKELKKENEILEEEFQYLKKRFGDYNDEKQEEIKKLKEWSLSAQMIEDTSAETIEEFEQDVRDAWEQTTCLESDSMNEVSQLQFDETVEELKEEIEKLKEQINQN